MVPLSEVNCASLKREAGPLHLEHLLVGGSEAQEQLLQAIFSYLHDTSLMSLTAASTGFYCAFRPLVRRLHLRQPVLCAAEAQRSLDRLLQSTTGLTDLTYSGHSAVLSNTLRYACKTLASLTCLRLNEVGWGPEAFRGLLEALHELPTSSLHTVCLAGNKIGEDALTELVTLLQAGGPLSGLQVLDLSCASLGPEGAAVLAVGLTDGAGGSLVSLDLQENELDEEAISTLAAALGGGAWSNLRVLNLSSNPLGCRGAQALAKAIKMGGLPALCDLGLADCEIGAEGMRQVGMALQLQGPLRSGVASLRVSGNYLSMAGALNLAFALRGGALPGLRTLDVSSNGIYGQGTDELIGSLSEGAERHMREINLAGNPLGPMGALVVAIALKGGSLAQLEALDMSTCELGMAGLKHLLGGLKSHGASRALQTLRLGGNGFGEEGLVELAALLAMPGCLRRLRVLDLSHSNLQDATLPRAFSRKGLRVVLE